MEQKTTNNPPFGYRFFGNVADDITELFQSANTGYRTIAGVIRNTGSGWELIADHGSINIDSVSNDDEIITINHSSAGGTKAVTFIAAMDDYWAGKYFCGSAGGDEVSYIQIRKHEVKRTVSLITHNGNGNFTFGGDYDNPGSQYDNTTGILSLVADAGTTTGSNIPKFYDLPDTLANNTTFRNASSALGGGITEVKMFNLDGTQKNLTDPEVNRFYVEQNNPDVKVVDVDPSTLTSTQGNIWIYGLVKV